MRKRNRYIKPRSKAKNPLRIRVVEKFLQEEEGCVGLCYPDDNNEIKTVYIDPRLSPKDYLDTLIHETIHHCVPKLSENKVLNVSTTVANLLWRLGYRKK